MSVSETQPEQIATARAHPNIALIKYWGKRDDDLILPVAGSLSLTLDIFPTTTTVELTEREADELVLNGKVCERGTGALARVSAFLDIVRARAGSERRASIRSINEVPTAAGLASSASGFAALAHAAAAAYGLDCSPENLSRLARRGSGSASRSVISRYAVWHAGTCDADSFATEIAGPDARMLICIVDTKEKAVSSRLAMEASRRTSPFFEAWAHSTEETLKRATKACEEKDIRTLGELTEMHAYRMHALIASNEPPVRFLHPLSYTLFDVVKQLREENGFCCYATADAGPNVVVFVSKEDAPAVHEALATFTRVLEAAPGPASHLRKDHLF